MSSLLSPAAVETAVPPVAVPVFSTPPLPFISVVSPPTAAPPTIVLTPVAPTPVTSLSPSVSPPTPDVLFPPVSTPPDISQVTPISTDLPLPSPAVTSSPSPGNAVFPSAPPAVSAIPPTIFISPPLPAVVTIPPPSTPQFPKERFPHHSPAVPALPSPVIPTKPAHISPPHFPIPVIKKLPPPSSANVSSSSPSPPAITLRTPSPVALPLGIPSPPVSTGGAQPPPAFSLETQAPVASPHPSPDKDITNTQVLPPPPSPTLTSNLAVHGEVQNPQPRTSTIPIGITVGLVIAIVFLVMLLVGLLYLCCRYKRTRRKETNHCFENWKQPHFLGWKGGSNSFLPQNSKKSNAVQLLSNATRPSAFPSRGLENGNSHRANLVLDSSCCRFSYDELFEATNGFSEANLLGEGGFGNVFKGVLPNSKEVAVKQLKTGSKQVEREFQAEVEIISRVHHKHLVSLVGYCSSSTENLLVYEFVPNNTLEFHLHGKGQPLMEWANRMKIAMGSAKGLAYLHEDCNPRIVHRDIKASNILLDCRFEAKVSDFGLAKMFYDTTSCISHVTTRVVGTFGYLAPEYASSGKVTDKSDVYSYGVMLLELITGRPPISVIEPSRNESLVEWARPFVHRALEDGDYNTLVDPRLERNYNANEMATMVACAAACVRRSARLRPRMSQIVGALEGLVSVTDLQEGITAGHSTIYSWSATSNYDADEYREDVRNFNMALLSQEHSTGW